MPLTPKGKNHLSLARKRRGFGQKQIAALLGHNKTNQISRYEQGNQLPNFETALKLGIIYQMPLHILFYGSYEACLSELESQVETLNFDGRKIKSMVNNQVSDEEFCTFAEKLKPQRVLASDLNKVRRHITELVNAREDKMNYSSPANETTAQ